MILSATPWTNNSDLMSAARDLGYINGPVLDPTYGKGNWWKGFRPDDLIAHDITIDGVDFRQLPEIDGSVGTVTFDPPYIPQGGRKTSTVQDFLTAYGLHDVPKTNEELRRLIKGGMAEAWRVLRVRGHLLVKCMPYVNGGRLRPMPRWVANDAEAIGFKQVDELVHLRRPGPQPSHPRQMTSRRNYSVLIVFRRG